MSRSNYGLVAVILLMIACFCGAILTSGYVLADGDSVVDQINITVAESCTLAGVGMDSHVATLHNVQYSGDTGSGYENGIGKTTMTAFCNDFNGFSIYAIGFTGDSYTSTNHTKLVGASDNTNTVSTGVYSSGDTTSSWAMKITKVTDGAVAYNPVNMSIQNSFDNWHVVPDTYTKVAQYHANSGSSATDTVLGGKIESTYAVFVSASQNADTYTGQVKYTLVHPYDEGPLQPQTTQAGRICYYPNGSNVEGTMGCQEITSSDTSITLLASNFSREGYGFAGWSKTFDYSDNTGFLGPQEDIAFTAGEYTGSNLGLSLYARWIKSVGNLQGWTGCSSLQSGAVTALTDQRDNETYAVAKLADGKCWMIENMRLENTGTDNTTGSLAQGYNASFAGLADPEALWANNSTTANSLYSTDGSTEKTISGSSRGCRFPRYNNINTPTTATDRPSNPTSNSATNSTSNASMYSYGNYYTWAAAIADTTAYTTNNHSVTSTSICPSGWHLPKGGDKSNEANNEFWALVVTGINGGTNPADYDSSTTPYYTGSPEGSNASNALRAYPNNFVYSGSVADSSVKGRGSYGLYWSSTTSISNSAYHMIFNDSYVYPGTDYGSGYKFHGRNIRCLAPAA